MVVGYVVICTLNALVVGGIVVLICVYRWFGLGLGFWLPLIVCRWCDWFGFALLVCWVVMVDVCFWVLHDCVTAG